MSDFVTFCRAHGVVIDGLPKLGAWVRLKTEDKPTHRNGAVRYMGDHGFCQNWATMEQPALWQNAAASPIARQETQRIAREGAVHTARTNAEAARKAEWVLGQCELLPHAYLAAKGFPDELANVWTRDDGPLLIIPMRIGGAVVGCQLIGDDGDKKFLTGQRTGGAEFVFTNGGGISVLCEGYATGLSTRYALRSLKRRYTLRVCFSAGNMARIAAALPGGFLIADNDASGTGERVAKQIGWPYWMSDTVNEDANDFYLRRGLFALSQGLKAAMRPRETIP